MKREGVNESTRIYLKFSILVEETIKSLLVSL